mgnify:CR=1 FL=1
MKRYFSSEIFHAKKFNEEFRSKPLIVPEKKPLQVLKIFSKEIIEKIFDVEIISIFQ